MQGTARCQALPLTRPHGPFEHRAEQNPQESTAQGLSCCMGTALKTSVWWHREAPLPWPLSLDSMSQGPTGIAAGGQVTSHQLQLPSFYSTRLLQLFGT